MNKSTDQEIVKFCLHCCKALKPGQARYCCPHCEAQGKVLVLVSKSDQAAVAEGW